MNEPIGKKVIVLIEDEGVLANLLIKKLEQAQYEVKLAVDGKKGLELIHSVRPDLVLLDMAMPLMTGLQVLEKLHEEKVIPDLPVIIISNSGQQVEIEHAQSLGIRDFLIKVNFDLDELIQKVKKFMDDEAKPGIPQEDDETPIGHVLIVEDDTFLLSLLGKKVKQLNIKSSFAVNVAQARAILAEKPVDVILLDVVMPGGNGIDFLKELKANDMWKSIPVIITSNLGQTEEIEQGLKAGAVEYLVKANVTPEEIISKVKKYTNQNHLV